MFRTRNRGAEHAQNEALHQAHEGAVRHGGALATIISAFALLFSGYSFYESVLRSPQIEVYVPPQIAYTDPDRPTSPFEVFILPITLANDGARAGTVLSIDLAVTNPRTKKTKLFYSASFGPWGTDPFQAFAPISLAGRESHSKAVQFYPRKDETLERILDFEAGSYNFKVTLNTTKSRGPFGLPSGKVQPLEFEMIIDQLDYRLFNGSGTVPMWSKSFSPSTTKIAD